VKKPVISTTMGFFVFYNCKSQAELKETSRGAGGFGSTGISQVGNGSE
jgi:dUTPase